YIFFFSSRRRHTRSKRDWSSDVCSSDLKKSKYYNILICRINIIAPRQTHARGYLNIRSRLIPILYLTIPLLIQPVLSSRAYLLRSEERRVGKECRSPWWPKS